MYRFWITVYTVIALASITAWLAAWSAIFAAAVTYIFSN